MIAHLNGKILSKHAQTVVVDVNGIGYEIVVSLHTFYELPPETMPVTLHIHTHVREDQLALFGFLSLNEKTMFAQLLKVSGIGPKLAMTLLSGLTPAEIAHAIATENKIMLKSIPGIGQKVAERILIDLKGKILSPAKSDKSATASQSYDEALSALTHLGYTRAHAQNALEKLDWSKSLSLKEAITQGLKNLARG